jgi:hypothetical protein
MTEMATESAQGLPCGRERKKAWWEKMLFVPTLQTLLTERQPQAKKKTPHGRGQCQ